MEEKALERTDSIAIVVISGLEMNRSGSLLPGCMRTMEFTNVFLMSSEMMFLVLVNYYTHKMYKCHVI